MSSTTLTDNVPPKTDEPETYIAEEKNLTNPIEGAQDNLEKASIEHVEEDQTGDGKEDVNAEDEENIDCEVEGEKKAQEEQASEAGDGETGVERVEAEHTEGDGEEAETEEEQQLSEEITAEEEENIDEQKKELRVEEVEEEQPEYVEEPVDPAAPLDLTDSKEALIPPFELRPDQLAEVERLWEIFQDYTPAYTDLDNYITIKELVFMLKALLLMTYTEEQLMELITFVCRPPNDDGHISYEQFLRMVTIRQRDLDIEEELRAALKVLDPGRTGEVESNELQDVLAKLGNKLPPKILNEFIKEIDLSGEGKIGIEDVVAICGMDLRKDDFMMGGTSEPEEDQKNP